jgi:cysteinyl-tRNA synthetase
MRVYNTLSGSKEEFATLDPGWVKMYVCGPTTYNFIHLGNARPLVVFDTVRRYLSYRGYQVKYVQNFTDVDDKIINRAREEGADPIRLAQRYIDEYFRDADALGIARADVHPRVSEHIPDIIHAIEGLTAKGYAYAVDGDVYYRVKAFAGYGKLSGRTLEDLLAGARVEVDERKEDPVDFALWKKAKPGEPAWDSPWGAGRPGWHIECSVMSTKYLGETLDIHGGGADLIFPHHENEIAQAEAYTGQTFVRYWMHNGFITVNSEKMSKSLGNFFILRDILAKFPADVVRYYLIATHYRSPLDFDDGKLEEARKALGRLKTTLNLAREFLAAAPSGAPADVQVGGEELLGAVRVLEAQFVAAMDDDFNSAKALGYLFEMAHHLNTFVAQADAAQPGERTQLDQALQVFAALGEVLGIFMDQGENPTRAVDGLLQIVLDLRHRARQAEDFSRADSLRELLGRLEVKVEDKPGGSLFRYEQPPSAAEIMDYLLRMRGELKDHKEYTQADALRDALQEAGILIEDTREGTRWRYADA